MASGVLSSRQVCSAGVAAASSSSLPHIASRSFRAPLVSGFHGSKLIVTHKEEQQKKSQQIVARQSTSGKAYATAVINEELQQYMLPTWADFEMGSSPVYWETTTGRAPASGQPLTIYFNPAPTKLVPNPEFGIGFNGGFNQPIMCGGEPRVMTRKDRGSQCQPFYTIKINVPFHAVSLEFSFTDGSNWDGPYKLKFEIPGKWWNMPISFFNEGLAKELELDGACDNAIYPDTVFVQDRCHFPAGSLIHEGVNAVLILIICAVTATGFSMWV
jgi:hypothetical protein